MDSDKTTFRLYEALKSLFRAPVRAVLEQFYGGNQPATVAELDYVQVLEYAARLREQNEEIHATLLKRERRDEGWHVTQVFLDQDNELIRRGKGYMGRTLVVAAFDAELTELFGTDDNFVVPLAQPVGEESTQPQP